MSLFFKRWILAVVFCSANSFAEQGSLGTAQYLGNEGVLVVHKQKRILFDPLFRKNYQRFTLVPDKLKSKIFANIGPFKDIDAVFISHSHADHFDAEELSSYLHKYQTVQLIAPTQAINKLKLLPKYKKIEKQIHEISMKVGDHPIEFIENGIQAEVVRIPHVGWPERADIENLVYRVTIDNITIIHLGDSDTSSEHYLALTHFWEKRASHHAFIPGIFAVNNSSEKGIKELINARKITHIHIPMNIPNRLKELKVDYFSQPSEVRKIGTSN